MPFSGISFFLRLKDSWQIAASMPTNLKLLSMIVLLLLHYICSAQSNVWVDLHRVDSLLQVEKASAADSVLSRLERITLEDERLRLELAYLRGFYYNNTGQLEAAANTLVALPQKAAQASRYTLAAKCYILLGLIQEKTSSYSDAAQNLYAAFHLIQQHGMDSLYGWYYVRISSWHRLNNNLDSALLFAKKAIPYAEKWGPQRVLSDAYLLTGIVYSKMQSPQALPYFQLALQSYLQQKNNLAAAAMYNNLSKILLQNGNVTKALFYNDSAGRLYHSLPATDDYHWLYRAAIFEYKRQYDSALFYYKKYSDGERARYEREEVAQIKKITEKYEVASKEAVIRQQQYRLRIIISFAVVVAVSSLLLCLQYLKIIRKNKRIKTQVGELTRLVQQKGILLSELQHRVKNNLQHVLSLMDIQKESLNHNNIEEVIRENQNRVHAMALLHSKLTFSDNGDSVDFEQFLHEMAILMKTAYREKGKDITVQVHCHCHLLSIDTALPLGMMVVELLSNGLKHAFKAQRHGTINMEIVYNDHTAQHQLTYTDDGVGFDLQQRHNKGLGLELLRGFMQELNATFEAKHTNGTSITILF